MLYEVITPYAPDTAALDGQAYAWTSWGDVLKPNAGTETWGTYQGDFYAGEAAVSFHQLGKGTVTYVGADSNSGDLEQAVLTRLYNKLGIAVEGYPKGIIVEYRDGFGIALNYADQAYEMSLPAGTEILVGETTIPTAGVLVWKVK